MNTNLTQIENKLWSAADELRANSSLKGSEYSTPVLGLIFLKYADYKFKQVQKNSILKHRRVHDYELMRGHSSKHAVLFICQKKQNFNIY